LRRQGERYFADGLRDITSDRRLAILAVCAIEWAAAIRLNRPERAQMGVMRNTRGTHDAVAIRCALFEQVEFGQSGRSTTTIQDLLCAQCEGREMNPQSIVAFVQL
ncbi:hypothetical protein ABLN87_21640, partial [Ruegeria sp. SCPT10]|uniref:hypothetical protein n=1 Tax=Ruegeria sp. SCP10 TaxID=3141377 RepID=UPI003337E03C